MDRGTSVMTGSMLNNIVGSQARERGVSLQAELHYSSAQEDSSCSVSGLVGDHDIHRSRHYSFIIVIFIVVGEEGVHSRRRETL